MRTSVAVCVLTCDRNDQLTNTLRGLAELAPVPADVRVIVVDNDPEQARSVVDRFDAAYVPEPTRGIASARNRAIEAAGDSDFVAFIDDDEVPDPEWLSTLLRVQTATGASIVVGRVISKFVTPPASWVLEAGFFDRPRFPTGTRMRWAFTGNVLIARRALEPYSPVFDERYNFSGGEDTHYFIRAYDDGVPIVSADEAVVFEHVPPTRTTWKAIMRREYRRGNTLTLCMRDLHPGIDRWIRRALQGCWRIAQGVGLLCTVPARGRVAYARAVHRMWFGLGLLSGLVGLRIEPYRPANDQTSA